MPRYKISVMENWCRDYIVIADSPEKALEKYNDYFMTGNEEEIESIYDPFYLDDANDITIYDEDNKVVKTTFYNR